MFLDVGPGVEIVLAACGTVKQILQLSGRNLRHLPDLPLCAGVVEVHRAAGYPGHLVVRLHADHDETGLLEEGPGGHGAGPVVHTVTSLARHRRAVVLTVRTPNIKEIGMVSGALQC